jgi:CDP-glucose 4,6-dehydratase
MLAALMLDGRSDLAQEWNFGPDDEATISVEDLAAAIIEVWGKGSMTVATDGDGPHEATTLRLDTTKARRLLGYRPLVDVRTAIEMAVRWYSQYGANPTMARSLSEGQIDEYMARAK